MELIERQRIADRINYVSEAIGETSDCVVKALALLTNIRYEDAWRVCRWAGRPYRKGMLFSEIPTAITKLGYETVEVTMLLKAITLRGIEKEMWALPGKFLIYTPGHIIPFVEGKIWDFTAGKLTRVNRIFRFRKQR